MTKVAMKDRTAFTKRRLSNHHQLMIEKVRHDFPKPPEFERRCPFCSNHVENEIHFLLNFPTFTIHRESLITLATNTIPGFRTIKDA